MTDHTVKLHRVLRCNPERIYKAFLDADALAKWLPPYGFTGKVHHLDASVGGGYHMSFTNFGSGGGNSFSAEYLELIPGQTISYLNKFDDPALAGTFKTTITLKAVLCGTDVHLVQENIPAVIPVEMCYLGWQESLTQLAALVEPNIPG